MIFEVFRDFWRFWVEEFLEVLGGGFLEVPGGGGGSKVCVEG